MAELNKIGNSLETTYTLEDFISLGKSSVVFTYNKLSLFEKTDNGLLPSFNVIDDYLKDMKKASTKVVLSETEQIKYKYKPKLLAYDVYGSQELYFVIMAINDICNMKEFNFSKLKLLTKEQMKYIINNIYNAEQQYIKNNLASVKNK